MRVGSLFSGIGGLDLGLERAGMDVRWQCEIDPYARKVLAKHWPDIPCYDDVRNLPDDIEPVDLICGGYPCQPFSQAGLRLGDSDERYLWPFFADTIRLVRPNWVLLENVPNHLGVGFDRVLADLAALGFDAEWQLLPASSVGAPHQRYRLFVVGYLADADSPRLEGSRLCGRPADSGWWRSEPQLDRVAHGVPSRVDRLRALGNAVVPQVAELIGHRILASTGTTL